MQCRAGRLPGIPSSQLGLESYTGELDNFGVESCMGFPGEPEAPGPDMHSVMEEQLKIGTKPLKRTIF
jgi:proteasome maturation protein